MKSKNIPADISAKSIKEAQNEIKMIMEKLENKDSNLEDLKEQYNRMMLLNNHVQNQFKQKASEIKNTTFQNNKKNLSKNLK